MSARRLLALSLVLLLAPPTWAQTGFEIGARVTVINTKKLKVRSAPNSASTIGTQPGGATGTIVGGTGALVGGFHWWQINYDTGVDGYSPQEFLQVTSSPPRTVSIDRFTAMPTTITAGESATLTWETSNATAVTLNGVPVPADGTLTVAPTATTDYDLLADGVSGRITLTVTEPPPPPPPTVTLDSFTAIPTTITAGESATLTWETSNATAVTLNGVPVPADGTLTVAPTATTDYDLLADGVSGRITLTVTQPPPPPPPPTVTIDSFTVAPGTIAVGESATLTWETSNATTVTLNGAIVPADGALTVAPPTTTSYDLLADGVSGRITLTVTQPPPPPPTVTIDSFRAVPSTIAVGQSATLTWETSNATTVTLNGATVPADGALTVSPPTTTSYDLLADGVSLRLILTVTEEPPPPPASTIDSFMVVPTTITAGESATLTWETSNATTVTLNGATVPADGALTVSPPTTTSYDLLADGVSLRLILTVTEEPPPPPASTIDSFTVVPTTITAGESATLTWETSNAATVTLNGTTVPADGALTVSPPTTTSYDLLADGVSLRLILTVTPEPPPPPGEQPPGTWTDLGPATKFSTSAAVCGKPGAPAPPACLPEFMSGGGNNQVSSAIDAWVDGDYAGALGLFVIPRGGGHADWAGNQVVGFNPATGGWVLLTPHSTAYPPMSPTGTFPNPLSDGTPPSVHSYGAVAWMPWLGTMWSGGGIYWSPGGESSPRTTWWWNPQTPALATAWTRKADRPGGYGTYTVVDPVAQRLLMRTSAGLYAYDHATDTYQLLYTQSIIGGSSRALSPDRKLYSASAQSGGGVAIQRADLNNLAAKEIGLVTTGGPVYPYGAGLRFDAGRLVLFALGPTATTGAIWTLVPDNCGTAGLPACVWTREVPPDGVHPPKPHVNGTWKRFFAHGCDYFVIVNGTTNVWKYRPSWTTEGCEGG